jgi:exopolysaccharide biosynthesis polyprenyl glycosylphosphotransferase
MEALIFSLSGIKLDFGEGWFGAMDGFVANNDDLRVKPGVEFRNFDQDRRAKSGVEFRDLDQRNLVSSGYDRESHGAHHLGNWIAAGEIGCFASAIVINLLTAERGGMLSVGHFVFSIVAVCSFAILATFWLKQAERSPHRSIVAELLSRAIQVAALVLVATIVATEFGGASWEQLQPARILVLAFTFAAAGVLATATPKWVRRNHAPRCVVVFSADESALELAQHIRLAMPQTKVCLYPIKKLTTNATNSTVAPMYADPKLAELSPDVAIINSKSSDPAEIGNLVAHLAPLPVDVLVHAPRSGAWGAGVMVSFANMPFIRIFPKPLHTHQILLKRLFDLTVSAALIFIMAPLLMLVAIMIKATSPGPVLFCQPRVGARGSHFTIYKFRTMHVEATDLHANAPTIYNDPRVTKLGAYLRMTSIDELPQLFNVLLGSMSLVGPRPHAMNGNHFSTLVGHYHARHRVKPGITGLAQVMGWRGLVDSQQKIEQRIANDLRYISDWSLVKDIQIIWRTIFAVCGKHVF